MTEKEELLEYYAKKVEPSYERNSMGCPESWYDPFFAIYRTFDRQEIEGMTDQEIGHLISLAKNMSDAFY